ncbi:hypothetical protein BC831DRAFT_130102 [Entophlyctis helioformis]|nr:hypothetical protein BC831DRAFT_130102 [Entophlyctis helioformis]
MLRSHVSTGIAIDGQAAAAAVAGAKRARADYAAAAMADTDDHVYTDAYADGTQPAMHAKRRRAMSAAAAEADPAAGDAGDAAQRQAEAALDLSSTASWADLAQWHSLSAVPLDPHASLVTAALQPRVLLPPDEPMPHERLHRHHPHHPHTHITHTTEQPQQQPQQQQQRFLVAWEGDEDDAEARPPSFHAPDHHQHHRHHNLYQQHTQAQAQAHVHLQMDVDLPPYQPIANQQMQQMQQMHQMHAHTLQANSFAEEHRLQHWHWPAHM